MADATRRGTILNADLVPYVDLLVVPEDRSTEAAEWLRTSHLQTPLAIAPGSRAAARSSADLVEDLIGDLDLGARDSCVASQATSRRMP